MKNKNGYSIKELIILFAVLGVLFSIGIIKGSYALEDAYNESTIKETKNHNLILAAELYAKLHTEKFKEPETYIYGSELVENKLLNESEEMDYNQIKIKITKKDDSTFVAEIIE